MIGAIIIGLLVGASYTWFLKKKITIKMPAGVPEGVANSFAALIPGGVILTVTTVVYGLCSYLAQTTPLELLYTVLQTPLQGLTDSFVGVVFMGLLIPFFWFFGVHGSTVVCAIINPLLQANSLDNQAILDAGKELTLANGGHIVTQQFLDQFMTVTGAGVTIGLVMYLAFFAKSAQCKEIGKLGLIPSLFNINEPVMFGLPVVLNPIMAVPFFLVPVLSGIIQYLAIYTGLCPMYNGVILPWTCPPIISGLLIGGWRTALLQLLIFVMAFFVYLPFAKYMDKQYWNREKEAAEEAKMQETDN